MGRANCWDAKERHRSVGFGLVRCPLPWGSGHGKVGAGVWKHSEDGKGAGRGTTGACKGVKRCMWEQQQGLCLEEGSFSCACSTRTPVGVVRGAGRA